MERTIKEASVEGMRVKRKPTKHVVYAVKTTWSDGQLNVVSRRYSEFYDVMKKLTEAFAADGGKKSKEKIIPSLQGKGIKFFGNNAMKRLDNVTSFTKKLFLLPPHISQCRIVLDFFKPTLADIASSRRSTKRGKKKVNAMQKKRLVEKLSISGPIAFEEYHAVSEWKTKNGFDLRQGQIVEVIEKQESGWWFVSREGEYGWVPASYLNNDNNATIKFESGYGEIYISTKSYKAELDDELSFDVGVNLQVIEKNPDGWWKVLYCGRECMVPSTHLKLVGQLNTQEQSTQKEISKSEGNAQDEGEKGEKQNDNQRKKSVPISRYSKNNQSRSNMDFDTLTKLQSSTFTSPEANGSIDQSKKTTASTLPRKHLEFKKSIDGGWVPQNITVSRSKTFSIVAKDRNAVEKNVSFSGKIFKSKPKKVDIKENSKQEVSESKPKKKADNKQVPIDGLPVPSHRISKQSDTTNPEEVDPKLQTIYKTTYNERKYSDDYISTNKKNERKYSGETISTKKTHKERKYSEEYTNTNKKYERKYSEDYTSTNKLMAPVPTYNKRKAPCTPESNSNCLFPSSNLSLSTSCPDLTRANEYGSSNQDLPSSKGKENENISRILTISPPSCTEFDESSEEENKNGRRSSSDLEANDGSDDDMDSSMEDILVTYEDLKNKNNESPIDSEEDVNLTDLSSLKKCEIYMAKANFKGSNDIDEIDLCQGEKVIVLEKSPSGWWLVEGSDCKGWAPSNFLELPKITTSDEDDEFKEDLPESTLSSIPESSSDDSGLGSYPRKHSNDKSETYVAIAKYNGVKEEGEVDLIKKQKVRVLQKTSSGWWLVESNEEIGWAPSNYLEKDTVSKQRDDASYLAE